MSLELLLLDSSDDEVVESRDVVLPLVIDDVVLPSVIDDAVFPLVIDDVAPAVSLEPPVGPVLVVRPLVWESDIEPDAVGPEPPLAPAVVSELVPEPASPLEPEDAASSKQPTVMRATRPRGRVRSVMD